MSQNSYDAIVIGGGIAGLACAALLGQKDLRVAVLEKNEAPGGRVMPLERDGFKYEIGAIGITPFYNHNLNILYQKLGLGPDAGLIGPEMTKILYRNRQGNWRELNTPLRQEGEFPEVDSFFKWWELNEKEQELAAKVLGDIFSMTSEQISSLDENDVRFTEFLSQYEIPEPVYDFLGMMANGMLVLPIDMMSAAEYIGTMQETMLWRAGAYCRGGLGRIVEELTGAVKGNGGELRTNSKIKKIYVEDGKVTGLITEDGQEFKCPIIISTAGIQPTVLKLIGEEHFDKSYVNYVKDLVPAWGWTGQIYFLDKKVLEASQTVIFNGDSYWNLERYQKIAGGQAPDDVWVYILAASNYDPSVAPEGKQILNAGTNSLADPESKDITEALWKKTDEIIRDRFPEIVPHIEHIEYAGPAQVSALARDGVVKGQGGEWGGIGLTAGQSGKDRPPIKAPIRGLFYVGLDAGSRGMGLQGSTLSAMNAAEEIYNYRALRLASL